MATPTRELWWSGDSSQRYWMELINVESWGSELVAPEEPRHALMHEVHEGDIVFHWVGKNNPKRKPAGLYGKSVVAGALRRDNGEWLGRAANTIELTGYTAFDPPILLPEVRQRESEILTLLEDFESRYGTVHYPFHRHKTAGLKPNQRYLMKFPSELLDIVRPLRPESDWGAVDDDNFVIVPPIDPAVPEFRRRYSGICMDPVLRRAIEQAAVDQATAHYAAKGYTVEDVGLTHSYDLRVTREGEVRHVEVKGSQAPITKIQLTRNEVSHAEDFDQTDLILVSEIPWSRGVDGAVSTGEGFLALVPNWTPSRENLVPVTYEYFLD